LLIDNKIEPFIFTLKYSADVAHSYVTRCKVCHMYNLAVYFLISVHVFFGKSETIGLSIILCETCRKTIVFHPINMMLLLS
jgi:hypothetical protein